MTISLFDLFSIGIGPSSSHTVGPMLAANQFMALIPDHSQISRIQVDLYGSLALTGVGHGTDTAVLNGLAGKTPLTVQPGEKSTLDPIKFDLIFNQKIFLPKHSNGLKFQAFDHNQNLLCTETYYSIGGGFIVTDAEFGQETTTHIFPYPYKTAEQLLAYAEQQNCSLAQIQLANEISLQPESAVRAGILKLTATMQHCIDQGLATSGILPGGLNVKRRAPELAAQLEPNDFMNWLNVYAMAVNEENAAGGRVVTAPTNGAAGIIPSVMQYYLKHTKDATEDGLINYFLTASAIGSIIKSMASISGAEVGCQGEVGSACAMAAAGLASALGGTNAQIENAAEIAMEHHLGLTCDPIKGLVQIPCIERNAMGAVKAVNACRMALLGNGSHVVPFDKVIETMRQTGRDMKDIYKETSLGGLAVNVIEC